MRRVLTYGSFDLFHHGHERLLRRARGLGDHLIVGVSTDEFNRLKGKDCRQSFGERMAAVENLDYVDEVFAERTWEQKVSDIRNYKVDVFVMGSDWERTFDWLADHCTVIYLPRTAGVSSTMLRNGGEGS